MIVRWHDVLAYYLSKPPTIDDLEMLHISLPSEVIEEIRRYYLAYQENTALKSSMIGFYNQIVTLIENA